MLEYTVLTTFACILAFFTLWFIRTAKTIGKTLYNAFLPSSKGNLKKIISDDDLPKLSGELQFVAMPWGWRELAVKQTHSELKPVASKTPVTVPWGWPGGRVPEFRYAQSSMFDQLTDKLRNEAMMLEIPFARNHNAVTHRSIPMLTYFSDDNGMLHFSEKGATKERGFQLPWGW